jgi:hypothetical protein
VIIFRRFFPLILFILIGLTIYLLDHFLLSKEIVLNFPSNSYIRSIISDPIENNHFFSKNELGTSVSQIPSSDSEVFSEKANEQCLTCHKGIEPISLSHPIELGCVVCHGGDKNSDDKEQAHSSLIYDPVWGKGKRNPSHISIAEKSCGQSSCHSSDDYPNQNHVSRVKKSLMGTLAGVISGLRYQWSAQAIKTARYGVYSVENNDPQGSSLSFLESLPFFSKADWRRFNFINPQLAKNGKISRHIADDLLRKTCFQCHLDSPPPKGTFRSQGCAACHMPYSDNGLYTGNDPTIDKNQPGHARQHRFEALPPNSTCVTCHQVFASQVRSSTLDELVTTNILPGLGTPLKDLHFDRGMDCIDCHTSNDIMGDGNIYSKQFEAVEIRCQICHGTYNTFPQIEEIFDSNDQAVTVSKYYQAGQNIEGDKLALSERKNKLSNVKMVDGKLSVIGKRTGKIFPIPMIHKSNNAHGIQAHQDKLECSACHSLWVPKCTGCHLTFNQNRENENPWTNPKFRISAEEPILMVGPRGKAMPMLPQPERHVTIIDKEGKSVPVISSHGERKGSYLEKTFINPEGYSGSHLAFSYTPHTVSVKARNCEDCHLNPETIGLGSGRLIFGKNISGKSDLIQYLERTPKIDKSIETPPGAKTTIKGFPVAGTSQAKARLFNQKQISRILKVGNCLPCHDKPNDKVYQNINKSYKFAGSNQHRQLRQKILKGR